MPKIANKRILYLIIISIILFLFIWLLTKSCGTTKKVEYEFEKVTRGEVKKTISVTGNIDPIEITPVLSKIPGFLLEVLVDSNQEVRAGQVIARFDKTDFDNLLTKLTIYLESAKLNLVLAETDFETKKSMIKDNLISKQEYDRSEINFKLSTANYKSALIDYNNAVKDRNNTVIYAPVTGFIYQALAVKNTYVGKNQTLFTVAGSMKKMLLTINIDESDVGYIKKGNDVTFNISAFPDKIFNGKIDLVRINPIKTGALVSYQATVLCDNSELLLKPGMSATATVIVNVKKDVLRVLNQAFLVNPKLEKIKKTGKFVWKKKGVLSSTNLESIEVKTGLTGDMYTEIFSNLKEGEEILVKINEMESKKY